MPGIEQSVINFAVYGDGTEYLGMAEVAMPEISNIVQEISGAGISGKVESVILGHIEAMSLTLNFRTLTRDAIILTEQRDHQIDLRVAQQVKDTVTGKIIVTRVKHVLIIQPKKLNPGKAAPASTADASGEYACSYLATFIDGQKLFETDPLNFIYFVNGVDYLAEVRAALGK